MIGNIKTTENLERWLGQRGLSENPFAAWDAAGDPKLPHYFVDTGQFDELLHRMEPCIIFANQGLGKTAQRRMIEAECRPAKPDSLYLAVDYTHSSFEQVLKSVSDDVNNVRADHHVTALLRRAISLLADERERDDRVRKALTSSAADHLFAAYLDRYPPYRLGILFRLSQRIEPLDELSNLELLQGFAKLVQIAGLSHSLILVDGLDEFPTYEDNPLLWPAKFLAPLLGTLSLIECPGLAFKFFLPLELEPALRAQRWFRPDRLRIFPSIIWTTENLQKLISQRLVEFSKGGRAYTQLAELCDEHLAQYIDAELIHLAKGSPRSTLRLADMLLHQHCRQPDPPARITASTWETVKVEWVKPESYSIGLKITASGQPLLRIDEDEKAGFVLLGDKEIKINRQDYLVLLCLYNNIEKVCTRDQIAKEAWRNVKVPGAVGDAPINASIKRLRENLGQESPKEGYIETIKGQGYRLYSTWTQFK